jgi:hypothetical protein
MSIGNAFCIEMDQLISIQDAVARSSKQNGIALNFLCADPVCRANGARIIGVNYRDRDKPTAVRVQDAHFRVNHHDLHKHRPDCNRELKLDTEATSLSQLAQTAVRNQTEIDHKQWIEEFDATGSKNRYSEGTIQTAKNARTGSTKRKARKKPIDGQRKRGKRKKKTIQVEKLVTESLEQRKLGQNRTLRMKHDARVFLLRSMWKPIALANIADGKSFYSGTARIELWKNHGYQIRFFDAVNRTTTRTSPPSPDEAHILLAVTHKTLDKHAKRYLLKKNLKEVAASENRLYAHVYMYCAPEIHPRTPHAWLIRIENLSHLAVRIVRPKARNPKSAQNATTL